MVLVLGFSLGLGGLGDLDRDFAGLELRERDLDDSERAGDGLRRGGDLERDGRERLLGENDLDRNKNIRSIISLDICTYSSYS